VSGVPGADPTADAVEPKPLPNSDLQRGRAPGRALVLWHSPGGRLARTILWRAVQALPVLLGVLTITFVITRMIGDPVAQIAGPLASEAEVEALRERLGLADPIHVQYWNYVTGLVQGDLGRSLQSGRPITTEISERIGGTLTLIVLGTLFATIWGIALGALAAHLRRSGRLFHGLALVLFAIPDFVLGLLLLFLFFHKFGIAPAPLGQLALLATPPPNVTGGAALDALIAGQWEAFRSALGYLILPVLTVGLHFGSPIAKLAEGAMLETRRRPFVEYAQLAGLPRRRVFRYTLRNSLPSIITMSGVIAGYLIGGIVLVEIVFSWGGLGQYAAQVILSLDLTAIQAFVLLAGVAVVLIYLFLDIAYSVIDPRVRVR
jgi:ABC-type dipeptide/oligopeptide/nickel transport system permease component